MRCCSGRCFRLSICISGLGQLCYQVFLDLGKANSNIGDLLAVRTGINISFNSTCTEHKLESVTYDLPTNTFIFLGLAKLVYSSEVTVYKYWVSGILLK